MKKFYTFMIVAIVALLGNAILQSCLVQSREEAAALGRYETLSYHELAVRFTVLQGVLSGTPKTWSEYFATIRQANMLEGAARKALASPTPVRLNAENDRDEIITRTITTQMSGMIAQYQNANPELKSSAQGSEWQKAYDDFTRSGANTLINRSTVQVPGAERLLLWWMLFHFGAMPFMLVHYCIRIRRYGMRVRFEFLGNPAFPMAVFFWEVGLFKYPRKINVMAQLRRAQRWAAFVLSSAIPCFAAGANSKVCEKEPVRWSASTSSMTGYPGLEGAMFWTHPVEQSTLTVSGSCGLYAGVWNSKSLTPSSAEQNFGNEVDLFGGWAASAKGLSLNLSATYLDVSPLRHVPRGDVFQFGERISKKYPIGKGSVSPYLWFREAIPVRGSTPVGGWFLHMGSDFSIPIGKKFVNGTSVEVVRDSGAFGYNPAFIGRLTETPSWKLNKHTSLQFPVVVQTMLSHAGDSRRTNITPGISLAVSF